LILLVFQTRTQPFAWHTPQNFALSTGPHGGNVQLVLDFIISICLERKEQNFVEYAKQMVVFLSEFFPLLHHVLRHNLQQEKLDDL
jgi:hypothetical protein